MRSTLACHWCRSAKVKCHHNGSPPCRACTLHRGRECILTKPKHASNRVRVSARPRKDSGARIPDNLGFDPSRADLLSDTQEASRRHLSQRHPPSLLDSQQYRMPEDSAPESHCNEASRGQTPLTGLSKEIVERAFHTFIRQFPEFNFFHQPSFVLDLDQHRIPDLLLCAILAVTARFIPEVLRQHGSAARTSRTFADYVRQHIMQYSAQTMDLYSCQALVMLCLYDWGEGEGSRAWIYNGMASRIAHGVHAANQTSSEKDVSAAQKFRLEEARRTVWACYLVDAMIGCGKCHASSHSMSVSEIPLPLGEDDFAFEGRPVVTRELLLDIWDPEEEDYRFQAFSIDRLGCDSFLLLIIQGFSIWHRISAWVSAGGRKRDSLASKEPPWKSDSFAARSLAALNDWRGSQHPQLVYSGAGVNFRVYISRGEGERFAILNLIYYLSVIFLHREYLSFALPIINRAATDPGSPALLSEDAPDGWWERCYQTTSAAAANIIMILQELEQRGIEFQTPFTCFCVFSAAIWILCTTQDATQGTRIEKAPDGKSLSDQLVWAYGWLGRACKVWGLATGWYRTLLTLCQLYRQLSLDLGYEMCPPDEVVLSLEENMQRLAGLETMEREGDIPTANILLLLQRQQREHSQRPSGPRSTTYTNKPRSAATAREAQDNLTDPIMSVDPMSDAEVQMAPLLTSPFLLDQDLFSSVLHDTSGNWFQSFVNNPQFPGG
ncbi:uncharacterized protein BO72DRAFT_429777 [Aspergillus fijiensis CBS 313.89]|uniref:Zn(2)-C6 fungal-type domain-containing protein n=1 Tax=Aspergillus fijiensis CBS 313.89 TaxID=1448319 RepID=A0A8G1RPD7_9EURO|nr:uncharacterized protein BO72DRAFT_429777 [Aspergillus fijiensis CBS 313.89]RAK77030.1 hypothetical protein BO72DRAFT_429777 [Aspergillus fijiensis CBS 313.89]